jgi:hypothetical protein
MDHPANNCAFTRMPRGWGHMFMTPRSNGDFFSVFNANESVAAAAANTSSVADIVEVLGRRAG